MGGEASRKLGKLSGAESVLPGPRRSIPAGQLLSDPPSPDPRGEAATGGQLPHRPEFCLPAKVQSPQPATQPPGVSAASAAKAPSPGAPVPVRQRHQLPGGAGGRSGGRPTALADPQPQPSDLHSGLSLTGLLLFAKATGTGWHP